MKTKELTCMSMLISSIGALLLLDRMCGYVLADMCPIFIVACMLAYSKKYNRKNLFYLSIGILFVGFLFGNAVSYIYFPVSIFVGYISSYKVSWKTMLFSFFAGELIVTFILYPIFLSISPTLLFSGLMGVVWLSCYILSIFLISVLESIATFIVCTKILKI